MLPRGREPRRPLRRVVRDRRDVDRHLLPAVLPGHHAEAGQRALPALGRGRAAGRLPGLPALPARRRARLAGLELPGRRGRPGDAAHRRRRGRPGRRARARGPARLHGASPGPDADRRGRRRAARAGPGPAGADRPHPHRDDRAGPGRDRVRGRVRQRAPVQRHDPGDLRPYAVGAAPGAARLRARATSAPSPCGCPTASRCTPTRCWTSWPAARSPGSTRSATARTGAACACRTGRPR